MKTIKEILLLPFNLVYFIVGSIGVVFFPTKHQLEEDEKRVKEWGNIL